MDLYLQELVPGITEPGDDNNYGSAAMQDVLCLQALSKRIHYGKFVAEAKFRADPEQYQKLISNRDQDAIMQTLTSIDVEKKVCCVLIYCQLHGSAFLTKAVQASFIMFVCVLQGLTVYLMSEGSSLYLLIPQGTTLPHPAGVVCDMPSLSCAVYITSIAAAQVAKGERKIQISKIHMKVGNAEYISCSSKFPAIKG